MPNILKCEDVKDKVLLLRNQQVILNCDIAQLDTTATETDIELNFAVVKIKHKVTRNKN